MCGVNLAKGTSENENVPHTSCLPLSRMSVRSTGDSGTWVSFCRTIQAMKPNYDLECWWQSIRPYLTKSCGRRRAHVRSSSAPSTTGGRRECNREPIEIERSRLGGNERGKVLNREAVRVSAGSGDMGWVILFLTEFCPEPDEGFAKFITAGVVSADAPEVVARGILWNEGA
jgi:hypothetical protein